jgi:hypothetical protein
MPLLLALLLRADKLVLLLELELKAGEVAAEAPPVVKIMPRVAEVMGVSIPETTFMFLVLVPGLTTASSKITSAKSARSPKLQLCMIPILVNLAALAS